MGFKMPKHKISPSDTTTLITERPSLCDQCSLGYLESSHSDGKAAAAIRMHAVWQVGNISSRNQDSDIPA